MELVLSFSYASGQASQPASARLFIWLDTLLSFVAAWFLTSVGRSLARLKDTALERSSAIFTTLACASLFVMYVPVATEARFINALILTRQAAQSWKFFEGLNDKRILILTDRPGLYTVMDYGARDIGSATADRGCLYELSRHLYDDIYLIQEMDLSTKQPKTGFGAWADVATESVMEVQNTDSAYVRIARVSHESVAHEGAAH